MITQQTEGLDQRIKKAGCKYLCHVKIAENESGNKAKLMLVNKNYLDHKKYLWLKNDCDVIKPNEIMADYIQDLGGKKTVRQLGRINGDGKVHFWGGSQKAEIKYCLVEYQTELGFHWVLCDSLMNENYDPWTLDYSKVRINSINLIG